jgi:uncharacterized membrane protein YcaP (DUF421 family)
MIVDNIFGPAGPIDSLQECARAAVIFFYGLVVFRFGGRRVFAQWTALDIVVAIVMGSSLSRALTGNADLVGTLAAMTLLMALHGAVAHACARWPALSRIVEGTASALGADGKLDRRALLAHGISEASLDEALRGAGLDDVRQARLILLEPSGRISVLRREQPGRGTGPG